MRKITTRNDQFKKQIATLVKDVQAIQISLIPSCPAEVTMTDFEQYKKDDDQWFSTKLAHYERTIIPLLIFGSIHNAMGNK